VTLAVRVRPEAAEDVKDAFAWYESQRPGLGDDFLDSVRDCFSAIALQPTRYPILHRQVRRALLRRFPYCVFFRDFEIEIVVLACLHARRHPVRWRARS
jgi:plasmid stabilization system protein ParE